MNSGLFDLTGKKALVTGGNSGLGLAFARGLAGAGADVAIWGRREEKNREAVQALREFGTRITAQAVDVANEEEVRQAMREACEEFGRLDCVVVNAGFASRTNSVLDLDSSLYHDLLAVNQHGAFYTIREAARHMAERSEAGRPGGSIIVCGSLSIVSGTPGMSHYAAAKGALNAIVKTLAVELGPHQVRVNMICPGLGRHRDDPGRPGRVATTGRLVLLSDTPGTHRRS